MRRKFSDDTLVKVTKVGRYKFLLGMIGRTIDYRIRKSSRTGYTMGSQYRVNFAGIGLRWIETEYLSEVK